MKCIRCNTENISSADYCLECKAPLRFRRRSERYHKRKVYITSALLVIWASCFTFFFRDTLFPKTIETSGAIAIKHKNVRSDAARQEMLAKLQNGLANKQPNLSENNQSVNQGDGEADNFKIKTSESGREIFSGSVNIFDPWNRRVASLRTVLAGDNWLFLPVRACFGGTKWMFQDDSGGTATVQGGTWTDGDIVSAWQVSPALAGEKGVGLSGWDNIAPVDWLSMETVSEFEDVSLNVTSTKGKFLFSSLPAEINEIGIFVQDVNIVGWTFGQWLDGAYLLNINPEGKDRFQQDLSVKDFYDHTFANGREERFSMALALAGTNNLLEQIDLFLEGFKLQPKISAEDTPYYLLIDEVIKQFSNVIRKTIDAGLEQKVVERIDSYALKLIGDINLFIDVLKSIVRVNGYEAAITEIESTGAFIVQGLGFDIPILNEMHLNYYQEWLQTLVSSGDIEEGSRVHNKVDNFYSEDPYIHLLLVELEILKGNWAEAEKLLYQRNYPPEMMDRYEILARQITDLKGQDGTIVVRFSPGSNRIPLTATMNGNSRQEFLVDTGASMVTIPNSVVEELGLEIISGDHFEKRRVSTAGGVRLASEVIIDSLEIGGWIEYEVKALVLDIPDQPGLGLLGLNYLGRFRMDLQNDEGVLVLSPK